MTLDSNVVLDAFERNDVVASALIALHPSAILLQVASRTPDREARGYAPDLERLRVRAEPTRFRLDISALGFDGLASDEDVALAAELRAMIFPTGVQRQNGQVKISRVVDVDVVQAHLVAQADHLVTSDGELLRARQRLRDRFGLSVLTPSEALALVQSEVADQTEADRA